MGSTKWGLVELRDGQGMTGESGGFHGVSQNGWFRVENAMKFWMILGYPYFRKTPYDPVMNKQPMFLGWMKEGLEMFGTLPTR